MKFGIEVVYRKLLSILESHKKQLMDSHISLKGIYESRPVLSMSLDRFG